MSDSPLLFVYGSLRKNGSHNHLLKEAEWFCQAHIKGLLFLIDWYPGLIVNVPDGSSQNVIGDVYKDITPYLFDQLDRYEGDTYDRKIVQVTTLTSKILQVHTYIYNQNVDPKKLIVSADWLRHTQKPPHIK